MKRSAFVLIATLAALATTMSAAEPLRPATAKRTPQPRVRLVQSAGTVAAQMEATAVKDFTVSPITMESVNVAAPAMLALPRPLERMPMNKYDPEQPTFSLLYGGPISTKNVGGMKIQVGMSPYVNILPEDGQYKEQKSTVAYDFLRVSF